MRWFIPQPSAADSAVASELAVALGCHPLAARVLVQRGHRSVEDARAFLADGLSDLPDPLRMKGMSEAVERLLRAVREREAVVLYGDYDVDGVCATAILASFMRELGAEPKTYLPHRLREGYGVNMAAVEKLAAEGARVLVTLDCGITAHAEVARAQALGVDVIVVDHHAVPETMPPAHAVLNPMQPGCDYPTRHLCAAGVAFNLCIAMRRSLRDGGFFQGKTEPDLRQWLDLVALATIADVVPLTGANRILVRHGLAALSRAERLGVRALKEVSGLGANEVVSAGQVGFRLGPRINAAGRLDDAATGLRLLLAENNDDAVRLAKALDDANVERQAVEARITAQALHMAEARKDDFGLVLWGQDWHPGVVGIVASRVVERFHRPVVVIAVNDGVGKGSARSVEGVHLVEALGECAPLLERFGGHKAAAGLTIQAEHLEAFRQEFARCCEQRLSADDLVRRCKVDAWVSPDDLNEGTVLGLERLGPFGMGNPEPVLGAGGLVARWRVLPSKRPGAPGHLKLHLPEVPGVDAIGFGMAESADVASQGPVDAAFQMGVETFRGVRKVTLRLKALRNAQTSG
ncbi:MAG: single-stranded-DNA-specific exonuclease RecJ [Myxococcaceae bacterium]